MHSEALLGKDPVVHDCFSVPYLTLPYLTRTLPLDIIRSRSFRESEESEESKRSKKKSPIESENA